MRGRAVFALVLFLINLIVAKGFVVGQHLSSRLANLSAATKEPRVVTVTNTDNGKATEIQAGSPMGLAAVRTEMRLSYQCKAGSRHESKSTYI